MDNSTPSSWLYLDSSGDQKGPLPAKVIVTLLKKQILNGSTLLWKDGMVEWIEARKVEDFKDIVEVLEKQWIYSDLSSQLHGPMIAQKLLHHANEGALDGMTLIWTEGMEEWQPFGEVVGFKRLMQLEAPDVPEEEDLSMQLDTFDEEKIFAGLESAVLVERYSKKKKADDHGGKKRYVSDDGLRFVWNEEKSEWEETQEVFSASEDEDEENDDVSEEADEPEWKARWREKQRLKKQKQQVEAEEQQKTSKLQETGDEKEASKKDSEDSKQDNPQIEKTDEEKAKEAEDAKIKEVAEQKKEKRKRKGSRKKRGLAWNDKAANNWIYVSGLPEDVTLDEIKKHFTQAGVLATDPLTQAAKIRLYQDPVSKHPKGDASICYAKKESVELATTVLDGGLLRPNYPLLVKRAEFKQKGEQFDPSKRIKLNGKQLKIAKAVQEVALSWNDDQDGGTRMKLTIVVLKHMFTQDEIETDPNFQRELEEDLSMECGKLGDIDKITVFQKHPDGVVVIKFKTSFAAEECVKLMDGRWYGGRQISCVYWDGVTNFLMTAAAVLSGGAVEEHEEKQRLDEFGDWLESQDLPEEFQLQVEDSGESDDD